MPLPERNAQPDCPHCRGTKHVRTPKGWRRCECIQRSIDQFYISPKIRGTATELPERFKSFSPFPLEDFAVHGDYAQFCGQVWHSLLSYVSFDLHYQFIDAYRLVEIYLDQDVEFKKVRDLEPYDLVIVVIGISDLPNRMLPPLMCMLLQQRRMLGRPTWIYSSLKPSQFLDKYGRDLFSLLTFWQIGSTIEPGSIEVPASHSTRLDPRDV